MNHYIVGFNIIQYVNSLNYVTILWIQDFIHACCSTLSLETAIFALPVNREANHNSGQDYIENDNHFIVGLYNSQYANSLNYVYQSLIQVLIDACF